MFRPILRFTLELFVVVLIGIGLVLVVAVGTIIVLVCCARLIKNAAADLTRHYRLGTRDSYRIKCPVCNKRSLKIFPSSDGMNFDCSQCRRVDVFKSVGWTRKFIPRSKHCKTHG